MIQQKYQKLLQSRIEMTFEQWNKRESITERELYEFLHKLKGTAGTIGLKRLSEFCTSQLDILSHESEGIMPAYSLMNFKNKLQELVSGQQDFQQDDLVKARKRRLEGLLVLIIDDDLEFVSYIKDLLEHQGAQVTIALNGKRGIEMFYSVRPSFVIVDIYLPDMEGFEVLDQIADDARARYISVAITSVDKSRENKIKTYEHGALDFIEKPVDMDIFIPYLLNREAMRKKIDESIVTDSLTGVGNRRHFDEMLTYFSDLYHRNKTPFSLIMLDLDQFKKVNDVYGHMAGDEVLRKLGEVARAEKRDTDYVFRYGGEEFAMIATGANADEANKLITRMREVFNNIVFEANGETFSVNFSAGIASFQGDIVEVVSNADQALYRAKRTGRNKTIIYHADTVKLNRKLHIVIVDDDVLMRSMIQEQLGKLSIAGVDILVHVFEDGPSFLETAWYNPEENYIILLDGIMPSMDGLEVLGRLRNMYDSSNMLIAMMTARTSEADIKAALWLGADDYIMKPFSQEEVLKRVQRLVNRLLK